VATIKAGSYFGELAMLTGLPRGSFVMATSYCICSVLPYSAVEDLVEVHPEAFTTLVQTMVKMYKLKPDNSWKTVSKKMIKKFGLQSCWEAFVWMRGHSDSPDDDCLDAKSFDKALNKMKISHLDRRIFWSELDADASGMISYEEFRNTVSSYFDSEDSPGEASEPSPPPAVRHFLKRTASQQVDDGHLRRSSNTSVQSVASIVSVQSLESDASPQHSSKRPSVDSAFYASTGSSKEGQASSKEGNGIGAMTPPASPLRLPAAIPEDPARDGAIEALLTQNKNLLEAIQKMRLGGP